MVFPENTNWLSDYPLIDGVFSHHSPIFPWQIDGSATVTYIFLYFLLFFFVSRLWTFGVVGV